MAAAAPWSALQDDQQQQASTSLASHGPSTPMEATSGSSRWHGETRRASPPPAPKAPSRHFYVRQQGRRSESRRAQAANVSPPRVSPPQSYATYACKEEDGSSLHDEDYDVPNVARMINFGAESPMEVRACSDKRRRDAADVMRTRPEGTLPMLSLELPSTSRQSRVLRKMLGSPLRLGRGEQMQHATVQTPLQRGVAALASSSGDGLSSSSTGRKRSLGDVFFDSCAQSRDVQSTTLDNEGGSQDAMAPAEASDMPRRRKQPRRACTHSQVPVIVKRQLYRPTRPSPHQSSKRLRPRSSTVSAGFTGDTRPSLSSPLTQDSFCGGAFCIQALQAAPSKPSAPMAAPPITRSASATAVVQSGTTEAFSYGGGHLPRMRRSRPAPMQRASTSMASIFADHHSRDARNAHAHSPHSSESDQGGGAPIPSSSDYLRGAADDDDAAAVPPTADYFGDWASAGLAALAAAR